MGHKVFSLKDVPETEANGVRQLLAQSEIVFYETPSTFITDGAIWVFDETDITTAIQLIEKFEIDWQRTNKNPEPLITNNTWKEILLNLILWSLIAVVLVYIFGIFTDP
ncbi:MAG: DUF6164 family protein [Candidatus Thiodiazotropha sp.]